MSLHLHGFLNWRDYLVTNLCLAYACDTMIGSDGAYDDDDDDDDDDTTGKKKKKKRRRRRI